jgi:putative ATP-dependent endonuclease of OLD family
LALTGLFNGRYLKNELTQYLFNNEIAAEYLKNITDGNIAIQPFILIEVFIKGDDLAQLEGNGNSEKNNTCGISLKIEFDEKYQPEYEQLIQSRNIKTLPVEYYDVFWNSFARENITARSIPIKSAR